MDKSVTVKFWQLHPAPDGGVGFGESLRLAFDEPENARFRELEDVFYQLTGDSAQKGNTIVGDVIRLQNEGLPSRLKAGGKPRSLTLGVGEYLGYHTGFIFDVKRSLIGFEIKPAAAGLQKLLGLVGELSKQEPCSPFPVLKQHALNQLAGTKNGTFQFKIADPVSLQTVDPDLGSYRDSLVELKEMVDGAYVNVAVGVGPRKDGLEHKVLRRLVDWFLNERANNRGKVRSLRVVQPHEQEPILDFIKAQVKSRATLDIVGDPAKDWLVRLKHLKKALAGAKQHVKPVAE